MKIVYVLTCHTKLSSQDDLIEVFETEKDAKNAYDVIAEFGEKLVDGIRVRHPIIEAGYIIERNIRAIPMDDDAYEKMTETGNRLLSSNSVENYYGSDANPWVPKASPKITRYIPYEFLE